jgi:hypothetical protein
MDWLSATTFERSTPGPSDSTLWSIAASNRFQTPRRCQCRSRRQQVTPEPQPISSGSRFQAMPLCSTNTMPVSAARSPTGGRPRFPGRYLRPGKSGSIVSHSSSGTSCFDIRASGDPCLSN